MSQQHVETTTITVRAPEPLVDEFEDAVVDGEEFANRSDAIRGLMEGYAGERPAATDDPQPRVPPQDDEDLAGAYRALCELASDGGYVPESVATRRLAPLLGVAKEDVVRQALRPLRQRGYIARASVPNQSPAWYVRGLDK